MLGMTKQAVTFVCHSEAKPRNLFFLEKNLSKTLDISRLTAYTVIEQLNICSNVVIA